METVEFIGFFLKIFEKKGIMKFFIYGGVNFLYVNFFKMFVVKKSAGLVFFWCYNCLIKIEFRVVGILF